MTKQFTLTEYLQDVTLTGQSEQFCKEKHFDFFYEYLNVENSICAANLNGSSICAGFNGGGLVFQRGNKWFLRGIVSYAPDTDIYCSTSTRYGVFTDVAKHYEWIENSLAELKAIERADH